MPEDVLVKLDSASRLDYLSRSAFIREAVELKMEIDAQINDELTERDSIMMFIRQLHGRRILRRNLRSNPPTDLS